MRNRKQCRVLPSATGGVEEPPPAYALQSAKGFIENREPHARTPECATEAHALSLASREQPATFAQRGLHAVRQLLDDGGDLGGLQNLVDRARAAAVSVLQVVEQRAVPEIRLR